MIVLDSALEYVNMNTGTPVNTGGTATVSALVGDTYGNSLSSLISPIQVSSNTKTMNANNTTVSVPLWTLTGCVLLNRLWGVVTTTIGTNHTAAHFRLEDGTNTPVITSAAGTNVSNVQVGGLIFKRSLVAGVFDLRNSTQCQVREQVSVNLNPLSPSILIAKDGATTQINYRYTTTETPTSGAIQFFAEYLPLSASGNLVVV